jgi:hypothetical protein
MNLQRFHVVGRQEVFNTPDPGGEYTRSFFNLANTWADHKKASLQRAMSVSRDLSSSLKLPLYLVESSLPTTTCVEQSYVVNM